MSDVPHCGLNLLGVSNGLGVLLQRSSVSDSATACLSQTWHVLIHGNQVLELINLEVECLNANGLLATSPLVGGQLLVAPATTRAQTILEKRKKE